ncbi:MAG: nuclear transport factor 2 family protein [Mycobacterium sp.]|nr:nuclear transport factor 2 family protein [Mycobacterium sp.]
MFAQQWAAAWNAHDIEQVLRHFADDVVFASPLAATLLPESRGVVCGKDQLRRYWMAGIERYPDLHFQVLDVYVGVGAVVIRYLSQQGRTVCECLEFDDTSSVFIRGFGCYEVSSVN